MKNKKFDCIESKHKAAEILQNKLSKMTREQQLEYWQQRTEELRKLQREAIDKQKTKRVSNISVPNITK